MNVKNIKVNTEDPIGNYHDAQVKYLIGHFQKLNIQFNHTIDIRIYAAFISFSISHAGGALTFTMNQTPEFYKWNIQTKIVDCNTHGAEHVFELAGLLVKNIEKLALPFTIVIEKLKGYNSGVANK